MDWSNPLHLALALLGAFAIAFSVRGILYHLLHGFVTTTIRILTKGEFNSLEEFRRENGGTTAIIALMLLGALSVIITSFFV